MGQIGWGGPSTGPTLFFGAAGVSPFWCEPLRAGCRLLLWWEGGVRCFVGVNLSSYTKRGVRARTLRELMFTDLVPVPFDIIHGLLHFFVSMNTVASNE